MKVFEGRRAKEKLSLTERSNSCVVLKVRKHKISGDNSLRVPPVPIPNTEVKPQHADGTWLVTARESRSSPDSIIFGITFAIMKFRIRKGYFL